MKVFAGEFCCNQSPSESLLTLFQAPPVFRSEFAHLDKWNQIASELQQFEEIYNLALSFYRKAVGGRRAEDAGYMFIDAHKLLDTVTSIHSRGWSLAPYDLVTEKDAGIRSQFSNAIALVKTKLSAVLLEARNEANAYKGYFTREISPDLSLDSIDRTIQEMRGFLSFLSNQNLSYDNSLSVSLNKPDLVHQIHAGIARAFDVLSCRDDAQLLSLLSENPFRDVSEINKLFISFDLMLREKDSSFVSGINQALQDEVDQNLVNAKDEFQAMEAQYLQLKKV